MEGVIKSVRLCGWRSGPGSPVRQMAFGFRTNAANRIPLMKCLRVTENGRGGIKRHPCRKCTLTMQHFISEITDFSQQPGSQRPFGGQGCRGRNANRTAGQIL